jgi:hypothetical protein
MHGTLTVQLNILKQVFMDRLFVSHLQNQNLIDLPDLEKLFPIYDQIVLFQRK